MKKQCKQSSTSLQRQVRRCYQTCAMLAVLIMGLAVPALAADDPLTIVNNLSEFSAPVSGR